MTTELPKVYVAPSERDKALRTLGTPSTMPERFGCDVLWRARGAWWGVQRKELHDFLASVQDGRLSKELGQMADVRASGGCAIVVIEGTPRFTTEGALVDGSWGGLAKRFTLSSWRKAQMSIVNAGSGVMVVKDTRELIEVVRVMVEWSTVKHSLGVTRPKAAAVSSWGERTNAHWGSWFLQGIPGVGADKAAAIIEHFGGVPMQLTVSAEELKAVPGLGPKTIAAIIAAVGGTEP